MVLILSVAAIVLSLVAPVVVILAVLSALGHPSAFEQIGLLMPAVAAGLGIAALLVVRLRGGARGMRKLAALAALVSVAALLFEFVAVIPATRGLRSYWCSLNMECLAAAMQMYAGDNGLFPPSDSWCDKLMLYVRNEEVFVCPNGSEMRCGYAYNEALAEVNPETIKTPAHKTVILFESDAGWNAAGGPELLAGEPRHGGGDYYGYAGGCMNSPTPAHEWHPRADVMGGEAGIFWEPAGEGTPQDTPG